MEKENNIKNSIEIDENKYDSLYSKALTIITQHPTPKKASTLVKMINSFKFTLGNIFFFCIKTENKKNIANSNISIKFKRLISPCIKKAVHIHSVLTTIVYSNTKNNFVKFSFFIRE